ncbi:DUF6090 family protein [Hanstruepera ponticola]|uniref:DUF6090 family protein n=1 Tax=Hanstruepera ponticola TaxID=2042995 RepID=UPI001784A1D7|nr:DUF6090 family protein [Hanstruepera ponticola]
MIKFFRKIRQNMIQENRASKYMLYAVGEIILVVIGILIALQINNTNEAKKERAKELNYLKNIKTDLNLTITELDLFISTRNSQIEAAKRIIEHFDGKPIEDYNAFNKDIVDIYTWQRFFLIDNTFQELTNSGNLAIISNDSIKNALLTMQTIYKKIKYNEDHFRYDAEVTLYEPSYDMLDIYPISKNYFYQVTNGNMGELVELKKEDFALMLTDLKQKNGFAFAILEFTTMNMGFNDMKVKSQELIRQIDAEIKKD